MCTPFGYQRLLHSYFFFSIRRMHHSLQLHPPFLFTFLSPKTSAKPVQFPPTHLSAKIDFPSVCCFKSDEYPVGEEDNVFLQSFGPKEKESEDEARRRNWIERGWAPWEEILTPEGDFARKSLNEGEEVPLQSPEAIEAFKMLRPSYRNKKMKEMGLTEDQYYAKQFEIKGEIPEPLNTLWSGPLVVRHVPPRDWPPRGWVVDRKELEFIREAHKLLAERVDYGNLEERDVEKSDGLNLDRYSMFLKQYKEWVAANKNRLEKESYKYDQDYYPGRRKRGEDYLEGMYELPFYYPGQICAGKVTAIHLYQGAFVDIGGVHDGWVPIKRNDWFWIRHHINVGMHVIVELLVKRDPYRFRFPIEMRFVDPNIDHLTFNRFDFAPIFHREEDTNPDELRRESGRPPIPRKSPGIKVEEDPLLSNHPYVQKLWLIHNAEQLLLDDMESNPDKYAGKKLTELTDGEEYDKDNRVEYTETYYQKALLPKTIVRLSVNDLDVEAAFIERQHHIKMSKEAKGRGEQYKITKLRRNVEMDEYDFIHWRRSVEEREALIRDISCRYALGLPLQEPGRYVDPSILRKDQYDPESPLYQYDYWGEPKNSEKSKQERITNAHNKSIIGNGTVLSEMSYEDAMKQQMQREAQGVVEKVGDKLGEDGDSDDDDDFYYSILLSDSSENLSTQPHVNGTESSSLSDEGMFQD
ncbi:unnamed protein product [Cuscuta epithymum]|uniref:S1 motif domain-containing protein n=1 Tax=Cuscuta epithymum TaxID=186058 RepID=A0AAV0D040_9ASTE|nr:unnamed protein product [Cuscuta epithymum]